MFMYDLGDEHTLCFQIVPEIVILHWIWRIYKAKRQRFFHTYCNLNIGCLIYISLGCFYLWAVIKQLLFFTVKRFICILCKKFKRQSIFSSFKKLKLTSFKVVCYMYLAKSDNSKIREFCVYSIEFRFKRAGWLWSFLDYVKLLYKK